MGAQGLLQDAPYRIAAEVMCMTRDSVSRHRRSHKLERARSSRLRCEQTAETIIQLLRQICHFSRSCYFDPRTTWSIYSTLSSTSACAAHFDFESSASSCMIMALLHGLENSSYIRFSEVISLVHTVYKPCGLHECSGQDASEILSDAALHGSWLAGWRLAR